jgi:NADH pyrophosphatase NudC (nudix superfamily)
MRLATFSFRPLDQRFLGEHLGKTRPKNHWERSISLFAVSSTREKKIRTPMLSKYHINKQNPHPIPVVRLIIPNDTACVLIQQRYHTGYAAGAWCLPGGKIDYGDTVEAAAHRELFEETGLICTEMKFFFTRAAFPSKPRDSPHHLLPGVPASGDIILAKYPVITH